MISRTLLALAAFPLALLASPSPARADLLVTNVKGVRTAADGSLDRFTGLLVGDDGKVKRLLDGERLKLAPGTRVVDGGGRTLLPGLIDAHGHVMGLGLALGQLDLTGTRSLAELQQRLRDYAAANPDLPWITGRGWNQELWPDRRMPTSADLDAVVPGRPVWLERVDGHAAIANSAAMRAAGLTGPFAVPSGGAVENGLFVDAAMPLVERHVPPPTPAMRAQALLRAQQALLSRGLTAVADMGTSRADWDAMNLAYSGGSLRLRIFSYAGGSEQLRAIEAARSPGWRWQDRLRLTGVKLYADGALGSRGAWLKAPYADAPHTRGLALLTPGELLAQGGAAAARGHQLAVHAIGDAANDLVLSAFERLGSSRGDRRWRVEHAQVVDVADLNRFARGRIVASMQPVHQTSDRTMAEARLGPARLGGAYAWATLQRSGARLALGSDFPVEDANPFHGLAAAVSRQGLDGEPAGGWRPHERLSFASALAGFTRDAAYASFAEKKMGGLEPGQWADFILVDRAVADIPAADLARTEVLETWVAGKRVWERK
jgi:predicted amidohydrolase YtcJ